MKKNGRHVFETWRPSQGGIQSCLDEPEAHTEKLLASTEIGYTSTMSEPAPKRGFFAHVAAVVETAADIADTLTDGRAPVAKKLREKADLARAIDERVTAAKKAYDESEIPVVIDQAKTAFETRKREVAAKHPRRRSPFRNAGRNAGASK